MPGGHHQHEARGRQPWVDPGDGGASPRPAALDGPGEPHPPRRSRRPLRPVRLRARCDPRRRGAHAPRRQLRWVGWRRNGTRCGSARCGWSTRGKTTPGRTTPWAMHPWRLPPPQRDGDGRRPGPCLATASSICSATTCLKRPSAVLRFPRPRTPPDDRLQQPRLSAHSHPPDMPRPPTQPRFRHDRDAHLHPPLTDHNPNSRAWQRCPSFRRPRSAGCPRATPCSSMARCRRPTYASASWHRDSAAPLAGKNRREVMAQRRWRDYRTAAGKRPVRKFLVGPSDADAAAVLAAMAAVRTAGPSFGAASQG